MRSVQEILIQRAKDAVHDDRHMWLLKDHIGCQRRRQLSQQGDASLVEMDE